METAIQFFTHGKEYKSVKTVVMDQDVGVVVGRGHVITIDNRKNPVIKVGDVVKVKGMAGHFSIRGVEMQRGNPSVGLVIKPFEGVVKETMNTLEDAKTYVRAKRDEGVPCPCCGQMCKVYPRSLNAAMARFLIWLVREYEERKKDDAATDLWISVNEGPLIQHRKGGGDFAKMEHWGLIEQMANDDETKRTSGFWRPTQSGIDFVYYRITVPRKAMLYMNECIGFSEEKINIREALGTKFDYQELMGEKQ
jgi:hypothetical protein